MGRQLKEIQQRPEPFVPEVWEMLLIKLPVALRTEIGKEGVLAGGKGEPGNIFRGDGLSVQGDGTLIWNKAKDTLHQGRFSCAILAKQSYDLTLRDLQVHPVQSCLASVLLDYLLQLQHSAHLPISALQKRIHCPGTRQDAGVHFI